MTNPDSSTVWLTVEEVATRLNLSRMSVYRLVQGKEIKAYKFGRAYRISPEDFDEFIKKSQIS